MGLAVALGVTMVLATIQWLRRFARARSGLLAKLVSIRDETYCISSYRDAVVLVLFDARSALRIRLIQPACRSVVLFLCYSPIQTQKSDPNAEAQ
jgi:hypothetical protein